MNNLRWRMPLLVASSLLATYFLLAYFAVNPLAKRILPWVAEKQLASRASVEQVKFDPLRFILTVDQLKLTRLDGAPLAGFERLVVDLETTGMFHLAWHLKDIRLTSPQVTLDIAPDGKFNWADLIAKLNEDQEKSDTLPRVKIDHILIERGNIQYSDRKRATPFKAALEPLGLELAGLSTLHEDRGDYQIVAQLPDQGGTLKWKGDIGLNPIASNGSIDVTGIHLAKLLQAVPPQLMPVQLTGGELQTAFGYRFAMVNGTQTPLPEAKLANITLSLDKVTGEIPAITGSKLDLQQLHLKLPALDFSMQHGLQLKLQGMDAGLKAASLKLGKAHLIKLAQADVGGIAFDLAARHLDINNAQFKDIALQAGNTSLFKLPVTQLGKVDFDLSANSLKVANILLADGALQAKRNIDGSIDWQQLLPASTAKPSDPATPDEKPLQFDIASVELKHWQAGYQDLAFKQPLTLTVQNMNAGFAVANTDGNITVKQFESQSGPFTLKSALATQTAASLAKVTLSGGEVSLKDHSAKLKALVANGLQTQVLRESGKPVNWQTMLEPANPAPASKKPAEKTSPPDWKLALNRLALADSRVQIEDRSSGSPVQLDIEHLGAELHDATLNLAKPMPVNVTFQVKQGGRFDASGKLALAPLKGDLQLKLGELSLKPFAPYINQIAMLKLDNGNASTSGKLALNGNDALSVQYQGSFDVDDLAINEENGGALFLGWKSLGSDSLKLNLSPNQLHMDELHIVQPTGKVIIYEDKTINIKRILRAQAESTPPPAADNAAAAFPVVVEHVRIENANLEFADLSLRPQFGTHINTLNGVVNGLSTNTDTTAQVELDGKVDEYGSARIRGSIQPFHATDFTDLKLAFHNLEMNRLTPYSGKFAGRRIDSGKMSVDLEYNIKKRQLSGENKFVINKLQLGERVSSPDAVNLPLDLAIALLEDSDGNIDLDLPVTGNLDDPQFSYGKIVWKAIVNVLGKIATSPFRALGHLLGINSDKLEAVAFDPGSATLTPPEQEKLKAVAQALAKRPSLTLSITPGFDPVADRKAMQEAAIRRDVAQEMGLKLKTNETAGPVDTHNPKAQAALLKLVQARSPEAKNRKLLDKFKDYFANKPTDPVTYDTMLRQLQQWVTVSDAELKTLAEARATAMQQHLEQTASIPASRLSKTTPETSSGDGREIRLKMGLAAAK